jgi:hypothetical protein
MWGTGRKDVWCTKPKRKPSPFRLVSALTRLCLSWLRLTNLRSAYASLTSLSPHPSHMSTSQVPPPPPALRHIQRHSQIKEDLLLTAFHDEIDRRNDVGNFIQRHAVAKSQMRLRAVTPPPSLDDDAWGVDEGDILVQVQELKMSRYPWAIACACTHSHASASVGRGREGKREKEGRKEVAGGGREVACECSLVA